jgi:hypothetical protein
MATHIVIGNGSHILIDDSFHIEWADKGNAMPALPNTVHYVLWNNLPGQNEIQSKDASTGMMTGNTNLSATSDAVGSTTIAALLTWAETRKGQIQTATTAFETAQADDQTNGTNNADGKTWRDYDSNYS